LENGDLKRWLLGDDEILVKATALAVGVAGLKSLVAQCRAAEEWLEAAKLAWAMGLVSIEVSDRVKHGLAALELLQQAGSAVSVQQLELDMRSKLVFVMTGASIGTQPNKARMKELVTQNKLLRLDPLGLYLSSVWAEWLALYGGHPHYWDAGRVATGETVQEAVCFLVNQGRRKPTLHEGCQGVGRVSKNVF
jgi:hypothetical protein